MRLLLLFYLQLQIFDVVKIDKANCINLVSGQLQHVLFWHNEEEGNSLDWSMKNIGNCYLHMLCFFAEKLKDCTLNDYFNEQNNLLGNKKKRVLRQLRECVEELISDLEEIYSSEDESESYVESSSYEDDVDSED